MSKQKKPKSFKEIMKPVFAEWENKFKVAESLEKKNKRKAIKIYKEVISTALEFQNIFSEIRIRMEREIGKLLAK